MSLYAGIVGYIMSLDKLTCHRASDSAHCNKLSNGIAKLVTSARAFFQLSTLFCLQRPLRLGHISIQVHTL